MAPKNRQQDSFKFLQLNLIRCPFIAKAGANLVRPEEVDDLSPISAVLDRGERIYLFESKENRDKFINRISHATSLNSLPEV